MIESTIDIMDAMLSQRRFKVGQSVGVIEEIVPLADTPYRPTQLYTHMGVPYVESKQLGEYGDIIIRLRVIERETV